MWSIRTTRGKLVDIVQGGLPLGSDVARGLFDTPSGRDGLELIWEDEEAARRELPRIVVVDAETERDFLAWAWTYLPEVRPFTAFIRVADRATFLSLKSGLPNHRLDGLGSACLGLILGEAATYVDGRVDVRPLQVATFATTYSYAMARFLIRHPISTKEDPIAPSWKTVKAVTHQPPFVLGVADLQAPWAVVRAIADGASSAAERYPNSPAPEIVKACFELRSRGELSQRAWQAVCAEAGVGCSGTLEEMSGSREHRVELLEATMAEMVKSRSVNPLHGAFICGFLASLIAPGTMDHLPLLSACTSAFPAALLWYGLCAGLHSTPKLLSFSGGLGRRLMREVQRYESILEPPHCDVGLRELEMLFAADNRIRDVRTGSPGQLEVEIFPTVTTIVRWPPREHSQPSREPIQTPQPSSKEKAELAKVLATLDSTAEGVQQMRRQIESMLDAQPQRKVRSQRKKRRKT